MDMAIIYKYKAKHRGSYCVPDNQHDSVLSYR